MRSVWPQAFAGREGLVVIGPECLHHEGTDGGCAALAVHARPGGGTLDRTMPEGRLGNTPC